ncbi:hypothetical protein [Paraferrimonas sp. SM1919]|uniref:hypothetical protein n=1 Tax=Paraferrimonas sp. SM1919 TaxID=2662263 RepID=UPI0013D144DA|nr:hypothetical protein [Paraferrimonas sp. SM1919]
MSQLQQVLLTCQLIEQKGLNLAVATVKAHIAQPTALPIIIQGIQAYKAGSRAEAPLQNQAPAPKLDITQEQLVEKVLQLEATVKQLQAKLESLSNV